MNDIKIFGKEIIEESAIKQLSNCMDETSIGVLTPDAHKGYNHPIGGAIAYKNKISLSGVGYDICCGNRCSRTDVKVGDISLKGYADIMSEIFRRVSFGMGRPNNEKVDHSVFDLIANANFKPQREFLQLAKAQLGTVGGGNHFIDIFEGDDGFVWVGVHFGSRGFGHKTATGFMALNAGLEFTDRTSEGPMDGKPILFDVNTKIGQDYIEAMNLAGEYAYAGRDVVVEKVLEILGAKSTFDVHNNHNFAYKENHFGEDYWVVRKGCTPAFPNQYGFIGANMLDDSVIVMGKESEDSKQALYSTVHGAGRILSRTQAAGKKKWIRGEDGKKRPQIVAKGQVDFDKVKEQMKGKDIALFGAGADEAPQCYKNLQEVLGYMENNIEVVHVLHPVAVGMAGDTDIDLYKD